MQLRGKLYAESPIYRGNARKTLFTRDGDGKHRLVSLAGDISGTAQSLMDAFIGQSRDGRNIGLLNRLWLRLYNAQLPDGLISQVACNLQPESYSQDNFFDLRMGLRLDEDRWASEANANYKMETVFRNSVFDFTLTVNDAVLRNGQNQARLYHALQELRDGRFWFGAGKSKGLGRCRLEINWNLPSQETVSFNREANHLRLSLTFNALNPVLVGWNWGKVDPDVPAFTAITGRVLLAALRNLPAVLNNRLQAVLGGPILSADDWKRKLADYLPRTIAIWLQEQSSSTVTTWTLPAGSVAKLGKGKYPLPRKAMDQLGMIAGQSFNSRPEAEKAIENALGDQARKMSSRVTEGLEKRSASGQNLNQTAWNSIANDLNLTDTLKAEVSEKIGNEAEVTKLLRQGLQATLARFNEQVDRQVELLQSDAWVDVEIASREEHLEIKRQLLQGKISEHQWGYREAVPSGVSAAAWGEFLDAHSRVRYHHLINPRNLQKSITNDENFINFLKAHRDKTRQELAQPYNIDYRFGGRNNQEASRKYGKAYDTVFMRMLTWKPSAKNPHQWEIYIPGSTVKGAFRKRASQVLKTLWGEGERTQAVLDRLFGRQGQVGLIFFSDAYLSEPADPDTAWCSMDGIRMNPATGRPMDTAKHDYLYAYGSHLVFQLRMDLQDINSKDLEAVIVFFHLLQDFHRGDIPLGGDKGSGLGWVQANLAELEWLTGNPAGIGQRLIGDLTPIREESWYRLKLEGETAQGVINTIEPIAKINPSPGRVIPKAHGGFISHRAFGGYSGILSLQAETLTPLMIQESGQPSFSTTIGNDPVSGWDFFSMSPPSAEHRPEQRLYALPSKTIRGLVRHLYTIASDSKEASTHLSRLNPVDSLFGWVGKGQNQALMGRLAFSFGFFDTPELAWFKVPFPYGHWRYSDDSWREMSRGGFQMVQVAQSWRLFSHTPLAPIISKQESFRPDTVQASYNHAILPGSTARFTLRFWNLEEAELQRLMWCLVLENGLAHKLGKARYLGFGSVRFTLLPDSYVTNWADRYSGKTNWQQPLQASDWQNPAAVAYYHDLKRVLNVNTL